jgi:hypothetical protein
MDLHLRSWPDVDDVRAHTPPSRLEAAGTGSCCHVSRARKEGLGRRWQLTRQRSDRGR